MDSGNCGGWYGEGDARLGGMETFDSTARNLINI